MDKYWQKNKLEFLNSRHLTAAYSKSFYAASMLLPSHRRWGTFAVYGLCRFADNIIDNPRNRTTQEILQEIHALETELKIAYRTGESEHPVLSPFITTATFFQIPQEYPLELLKGVCMDLQKKRYKDFDDLYLFCYRVAGVVGLMMTHVLGYRSAGAFAYAEKLGIALQLTNILRDIKEDKNMGRIYIPQNEMKRFKVSQKELLNETMSPRMQELVLFQMKRAHDYYEKAHPGIAMLLPESQFAIYAASEIYRGILYKLEQQGYNPFKSRIYVTQSKKISIILRELIKTRFPFIKKGDSTFLKNIEKFHYKSL